MRGARRKAIARLAAANVVPSVSTDVLWYHADYVAPSWGHRLNMVEKIGAAHLLPRLSVRFLTGEGVRGRKAPGAFFVSGIVSARSDSPRR